MAEMSADEKLVRAAWVAPNWSHHFEYGWTVQDYSVGGGMTILARDQKTRALASATAAEFTRKRQQEIAELWKDIKWFLERAVTHTSEEMSRRTRILALLQSALAEAQKGMRPPDGN